MTSGTQTILNAIVEAFKQISSTLSLPASSIYLFKNEEESRNILNPIPPFPQESRLIMICLLFSVSRPVFSMKEVLSHRWMAG